MNIAVFVSGNGTNLQALIEAQKKNELAGGSIKLVVCDNPGAFALERAESAGIKVFILEPERFDSRESYNEAIDKELVKNEIELIVLAGFMRLLSGAFVKKYENRIMNVHPSLLPSFKGVHGIRDAFEYGVKITGVTVHFVSEELDAGPVIAQVKVDIEDEDTLEDLEEKIHRAEHELYPEAVRLAVEGKLTVQGRKVKIIK